MIQVTSFKHKLVIVNGGDSTSTLPSTQGHATVENCEVWNEVRRILIR